MCVQSLPPPPWHQALWASQACVQTDAERQCGSCYPRPERAFVVGCFAGLFWRFANAAPFPSRPGRHLAPVPSSQRDGTLSDLQLWLGSTFWFLPQGKGGEGRGSVSLLFLSIRRIDFLYSLFSGFLGSLLALSSPPSQWKSESPPLFIE